MQFLKRKDIRWNFIIVPFFVLLLLFGLRVWGQYPDVQAAVFGIAAKSVALLICIGLAHAITRALGWNLPNEYREKLMALVEQSPRGAFALLVLEAASILSTLTVLLLGLTLWQAG